MTSPVSRPIGEVIAEIEKTSPDLAAEVRAALSAKRVRDDLADAETLLREFARTGRDGIARALSVLLVEYDARDGRVVRSPQAVRAETRVGRVAPARVVARDAKGDVIL